MENLSIEGLSYLDEKLVNSINEIIKKINNKDIEFIYNNFIESFYERIYTSKEYKKILNVIYYSLVKINDNVEKNKKVKSKDFFEKKEDLSLAENIIDGILISARNEYETEKIKYYGYLLGNLMCENNLNQDENYRLVKVSRDLSYCQIKLINMYVISQTIQVPILRRENFTKTGIGSYKLLGILQDTLDMIQKSILNGSGELVLDVVQINPSKIKVQGIGTLLYNYMSINTMPYDELEELLDILSKKN